jgi:hypothetical protein
VVLFSTCGYSPCVYLGYGLGRVHRDLLVSQVIRMTCESSRVLPVNMRGDVIVGIQVINN